MSDNQVDFQYANECDLEIHCSPFGLSGVYIKIKGTNIMGIGSTMGLITGSTKGLIHYNDSKDLINQKYKLYVAVEENNTLRIDFTKIFTLSSDSNGGETKKEGFDEAALKALVGAGGENTYEEEEIPTLVFTGRCPEGRPDKIDPFIGIFSFERED